MSTVGLVTWLKALGFYPKSKHELVRRSDLFFLPTILHMNRYHRNVTSAFVMDWKVLGV